MYIQGHSYLWRNLWLMKITAKNLKDLPNGLHRIERCLYLRKRDGRSPTWYFIYQVAGKRKDMSMGSLNEVTLTQARAMADEYRHMIDQGIDPLTQKRKRLRSMRGDDNAPLNVAMLIDEALPVIEAAKRWSNPKHADQWRASLGTYVKPVIGSKLVEDVTRDDILRVLRPIWETKTETANRVRGRLEAVFGYAIATGKRAGSNPATWRGNLDLFLPPISRVRTVRHHDALAVAEVREVFTTKWTPPSSVTAAAIIFGTLTCARAEEFVFARWSEIDFETATWSCPAERRKDKKQYPHRVPLSRQAIEVLKVLPRKSAFIFPGRQPGRPINLQTPCTIVQKTFGHGTMHGMRSTFRDWAAEQGVEFVLAEKCLMHATGNEVSQAYQRSDLLEQRRPVMQAWADAIMPADCD